MKLTLIILKDSKSSREFDLSQSEEYTLDPPKQIADKTIIHGLKGVKMKETPGSGLYAGYIAEIPGVNTQGKTLEEIKHNIVEALQLIMQDSKQEMMETLQATGDQYETIEIDI